MIKRFSSIIISSIIAVMCIFSAFAESVNSGDEVTLIFRIGNVQNVSGVVMTAVYNSEVLTAENIVCNVGGSQTYIANPGEIKWNFIVYDGRDFDNEDIAVVTLRTLKPCDYSDFGIEYNCTEMFDSKLLHPSDDPNTLFSVRAVCGDNEYTVHQAGWIDTNDTDGSSADSSDISGGSDTDAEIDRGENSTDNNTSTDSNTGIKPNTDSTPGTTDSDKRIGRTNNSTDSDKQPEKTGNTTDSDKHSGKTNNTTDSDKRIGRTNNTTDSDKRTGRTNKSTDSDKSSAKNSGTNSHSSSKTSDASTGTAAGNSASASGANVFQSTSDNSIDTSGSQGAAAAFLTMIMFITGAFIILLGRKILR